MTKGCQPTASSVEAMRDLDRWNRPVHAHASLDSFLAMRTLADGIHAIAYCGVYLELNLYRRPSKAMLIFFNAALTSRTTEVKLPVFSGLSALNETDANVLMVSDPGLYLDDEIRVAWYAGAANMPLQADLGRVLRHIQDVLSIEFTVLYGASGGGFAALFYAPFLRNAVAVPCNPQIDLLAYSRGLVSKYLESAFGYRGKPSGFEGALIPCKPVLKLRADHMSNTRILYLQNALDRCHLERDFLPFLKDFGFERGKGLVEVHSERLVTVCSDGWGEGHRAAPAAFVYILLYTLTQPDGWSRLSEVVPELHARTANPFRDVVLSIDPKGFVACATLQGVSAGPEVTLRLFRGSVEVESVRSHAGEQCRFTTEPVRGQYFVVARIEREPVASSRSWRQRMLGLLRPQRAYDEMKSRVVVVGEK